MVDPNPSDRDHGNRILQTYETLQDEEWLALWLQREQGLNEVASDLPPAPRDHVQQRFNGLTGEANLRNAFQIYRVFKAAAEKWHGPLAPDVRVLDFGCGWGRVLRWFLKDIAAPNLHGIDVDAVGIDACNEAMPYLSCQRINAFPPTCFAADSFGIVYAYSVFSHLPELLHLEWLREFKRILAPGGVLLATTQPFRFLDTCRSLWNRGAFEHPWQHEAATAFGQDSRAMDDYRDGRFVFAPLPSPTYGHAVISEAYVQREWTEILAFREFIDIPDSLPQSLIVAQKLL